MSKNIVVLDYGSGNIRSVQKGLQKVGANVVVSNDFETCLNAEGLIIPGVGAFAACMQGINKYRGSEIVDKRLAGNRFVLGICVGMQVMFENGLEHGVKTAGLHQWPGDVTEIKASILPHMGWNNLQVANGSKLFKGVENETLKHFATHGEKFLASVENGPLSATQFHPEKSGDAGLQLLSNWLETV